MTREDAVTGVDLLCQLGYELGIEELEQRFAEVAAMPDHALFVAETIGKLVGVLHVFVRPAIENPREAVVQSVVVDEAFRTGGIGRMLMTEAERWGRERGCRSVVLSSNIARAPAHAFYAALGYRPSATSYIFRKRL